VCQAHSTCLFHSWDLSYNCAVESERRLATCPCSCGTSLQLRKNLRLISVALGLVIFNFRLGCNSAKPPDAICFEKSTTFMGILLFWYVTPSGLVKSYRRFERSYCHLLQYRAIHYLMTLSYLFMLRIFEWKTYNTIRVQRFKLSYTFWISWPCRWSCCYPWKRRCLFAHQHLETSQKSLDCSDNALRTSNFAIYSRFSLLVTYL